MTDNAAEYPEDVIFQEKPNGDEPIHDMRGERDSDILGDVIHDDIPLVNLYVDTEEGWIQIVGAVLGTATSRKDTHLGHPIGTSPLPGRSCSGCRWTDASVIYSATHEQYLIHIVGRSALAKEVDHYKIVWADNPAGVLKALLVPPPRRSNRSRDSLELPHANATALRRAGDVDDALGEVWDMWDHAAQSGRPIINPN